MLGVVPDFRFGQFEFYFSQTVALAFEVKDTP